MPWKALIPAEQRIPTRKQSRSFGKRKSVPFETLRTPRATTMTYAVDGLKLPATT
jgi:hypothetical protein